MLLNYLDSATHNDFLRKQKRLRILAAFTALGISAIIISRSLLGVLDSSIFIAGGLCIAFSLLTIFLVSKPKWLPISEQLLVLSLLLTLVIAMLQVGGINEPVTAIGPAIPILAATLISRRSGIIVLIGVLLIYLAFVLWQFFDLPLNSNDLNPKDSAIMRFLFLTFTAIVSLIAVTQHQTEAAKKAKMLNLLASHDPLTGALNRRGLEDVLQQELQLARRYHHSLSVLFIDVDEFKQYNDHYGHLEGDECLMAITSKLTKQLKRSSDRLARIGGDEFVAVLPNTPAIAARKIAERIRHAIEMDKIASPESTNKIVTITIGATTISGEKNISAKELINQADRGMFKAKKAGKNRISNGTAQLDVWPEPEIKS